MAIFHISHLTEFLYNVLYNHTPLYKAVDKENFEIVDLLFSCENLDVNIISILKVIIYYI